MVTGAAHGIGRATAELLASRGAHLLLCDIDGEGLDELARTLRARGTTVLARPVDVGERAAMGELADWARGQIDQLQLLVNNAGVLELGTLEETSWEAWEHVVRVNLWGLVHACRFFVPLMDGPGRRHIVNVASAAGEVGFSPLLAYTTTKFGVLGFSQALRAQLGDAGIGVSVVCPGLVETRIADRPRFDEATRERIQTLLRRRGLRPGDVAQAIVRAAERNQGHVLVGAQAVALHWARRLFPTSASTWLHRLAHAGKSRDLHSSSQAKTSPRT